MNKNLITLALALSLTACGADEIQSYVETGVDTNTPAVITESDLAVDAGTETTISGTIGITDANTGEAEFEVQDETGTAYGTFSLAKDGSWTYSYDPENEAYISASAPTLDEDGNIVSTVEELLERILIKSVDETRQVLEITIPAAETSEPEPENTAATFAGDLSGNVTEDGTLTASGTATVTDPDEGEAVFVASTGGMYGDFSIDTAGAWTYALDNSNTAVQALDTSGTLTDSITIESADKTASSVVITINGVDEPTADVSKIAKLTDTKGYVDSSDKGDTGELFYGIDSAIESGTLKLRFNKESGATSTHADDAGEDPKDAYITLYGSSTSTSSTVTGIKIKEGGKIYLRSYDATDDSSNDVELNQTYKHGEWVDVEVSWDASAASDTVAPVLTLKINDQLVTSADGTTITDGTYSSTPKAGKLPDLKDGVQNLSFRMADNTAIVDSAFYIDDIVLTSTSATEAILDEDFQDYDVNYDLSTTYTSKTNEAIVIEEPTFTVEEPEVDDNLQVLAITDTQGKTDGGKDTGELRFKLSDADISPLVTGRLEVSFRKFGDATNNDPDDVTGGDTGVKDAYIGVYGASANSGYDLVELRIQGHLDDGSYEIRNQDDIDVDSTYTQDDWVDVVITWDASAATADSGPSITMSIGGEDVDSGNAFLTQDSGKTYTEDGVTYKAFSDIMNGAQHIVLKHGDNDATTAATFYIDNMKIYSDTAGTTMVYSEDFESDSFAVGTELGTDANTFDVYSSNTNEAVVVDKPADAAE